MAVRQQMSLHCLPYSEDAFTTGMCLCASMAGHSGCSVHSIFWLFSLVVIGTAHVSTRRVHSAWSSDLRCHDGSASSLRVCKTIFNKAA
eukprot:4403392-Amphidinium_carterae.1